MANILNAIQNIVRNNNFDLRPPIGGRNRANNMGDALEQYIKDSLANSFNMPIGQSRLTRFNRVFSWLGSQNNPPDIIIRNGDAIEIKKVESPAGVLALNSSYPKARIYADSPMITNGCRNCEPWEVKDIAYVVGYIDNRVLRYLWVVYGDCYAASREIYERIRNGIVEGVNNLENITLNPTNELGRVNGVDPLGITDLRIRGMWQIQSPHRVFRYLNCIDDTARFQLMVLMRRAKYNSFPAADRDALVNLRNRGISLSEVQVQNPDNPAQLLQAKLVNYRMV